MGSPMALARAALAAARGPETTGRSAPGAQGAPAGGASEPRGVCVYRADPDTDPLEITAGSAGPNLRWRGRSLSLRALGEGR
jgi:hypothetical protein